MTVGAATFELVDGIILILGKIKNTSGYFAIDTGATRTVLNKAYCNPVTSVIGDAITFNGGTQSSWVSMKDAETISVSGKKVELSDVNILDMEYVEASLRNTQPQLTFLGSIGADILGVGNLLIDYPHKQVILNTKKTAKNAKTIKLTIVNSLPIVEVKIQRKLFRFVLDTGANQFVMDKASAPMEVIRPSSDADAPQSITVLEFAGKEYRDVRGTVADLSSVCKKLHFTINGIIGYQLLKDYVCCFDYDRGLLYLA